MSVYADSDAYETFTGADAPADIDRLLERASEVLDDHLRCAVYDVDDDGDPTDTDVATALSNAACAQVEFWKAGHEEDDILGPVQSLSMGGLSVQFGAAQYRTSPMELAPRAARFLRGAGILQSDPVVL